MGAEAYPGNPYDGHTLKSALQQASKILGFEPEMAICDLGYRGHNDEGRCDVQIVNRFRKRASRSLRRWWNRRSAIEPVIGHCKSEHRMNRNQLRGSLGDELNVIFAAAGFNIRKLMRAFALFLYQFFKLALIQWVYQLNQGGSKRFGKGRAREGKNLSSKGFSFSHSPLSSPLLPSSHSPFFSPRSSISPVMSGRGGGACRKIGTRGCIAANVPPGSSEGWS